MILAVFLAGMSFVIAVSACVQAADERRRATDVEEGLRRIITEQAGLISQLAGNHVELEKMIRAVAAASVPPTFPNDQSKVFISVPGPRTRQ